MPTLNWHKREEAVRAATRAPYRLLEPVAELSYGEADSENVLNQWDNLDALNALLLYYARQSKCSATEHEVEPGALRHVNEARGLGAGNRSALREPVGPAMLGS